MSWTNLTHFTCLIWPPTPHLLSQNTFFFLIYSIIIIIYFLATTCLFFTRLVTSPNSFLFLETPLPSSSTKNTYAASSNFSLCILSSFLETPLPLLPHTLLLLWNPNTIIFLNFLLFLFNFILTILTFQNILFLFRFSCYIINFSLLLLLCI